MMMEWEESDPIVICFQLLVFFFHFACRSGHVIRHVWFTANLPSCRV
jgi:hypothetical protein